MKINFLKTMFLAVLTIAFVSCSEDDERFDHNAEQGWVEFSGAVSSTSIGWSTTDLRLPIDVNVPVYKGGLNIAYTIEAVQGDYTSILTTGNNVFISPADERDSAGIDLAFANLNTLTTQVIFDVVLTNVDVPSVTVGIEADSNIRYRVSTPCPISPSTSFTGISAMTGGNEYADGGYAVVLTDLGSNQYSLDTSWGPNFVSLFCGGCVGLGNYIAPIIFSIDPLTFAVTVISGGEGTGAGNELDFPYVVGGSGTYDPCGDVLTLTLTQDLLTSGGVLVDVDVVLQGN